MNTIEKLSVADALYRINTELDFADNYLLQYPDLECCQEVETARRNMSTMMSSLSNGTAAYFVSEIESLLPKTAAAVKSVTTHMVAHAHIDMNWMWSYDETVAVATDTFNTMLMLMDRYPDFKFSQSQASVYRIVEKYDPHLLWQIAKRVKEGRWEVSSATWVEHDKNMSAGETQIRQVLYAKKLFKRLVDIGYDDIQLDFEPDTFGHSLHTPDILTSVGVKYYYHCRAYRDHKLTRWQAPDGHELLSYLEREDWYGCTDITPQSILDATKREMSETGLHDVLRVYGVGDHGGGPTVKDIESIITANSWPVAPTVKFSTYREYFKQAEAARDRVPLFTGEHNFVFTGCYTSQSDVKRGNRYSEKALVQAEKFAAIAKTVNLNFSYPTDMLSDAWEDVLFSQFHDILTGSGVCETRRYATGKYQEVYAAAGTTQKVALRTINKQINTTTLLPLITPKKSNDDHALGAGVGFWQGSHGLSSPGIDDAAYRIVTIYNPSVYTRSQVVEVVLWDMTDAGGLVAKDNDGFEVGLQIVEHHGGFWAHRFQVVLLDAVDVPAMGYRSYIIYKDPTKHDHADGWDSRVEAPVELSIENEYMKVELDSVSGAVTSMVLKEDGTELVNESEKSALFRIIDESSMFNGGMSSWLVGSYANIEPMSGVRYTQIPRQGYERIVEKFTLRRVQGELRNGLVWAGRIRGSEMIVGVYLDKGSKQLVIDCKVDWLEKGTPQSFVPQLNITVPAAISNPKYTFEVPFGHIERKPCDMDMPALRWVDMSGKHKASGKDMGVTVATDSKYGYRIDDHSISVSLIRSSYDPDLYPEYGEHRFSIAIQPHAGGFDASEACKVAEALENSLIMSQNSAHDGELKADQAMVSVANDNIICSSIKFAESGEGIIMRLYEIDGTDTSAQITLAEYVAHTFGQYVEVDSLERPIGEVHDIPDCVIDLDMPARSIRTILMK